MLEVPTRESLAALSAAANAILPTAALGFAHRLDDGRVSVLYASRLGMGRHLVAASEAPGVLRPGTTDAAADGQAIASDPSRAVDWHLSSLGVQRLVSAPVPGSESSTRFWVGLPARSAPTADQVRALHEVAQSSASAFSTAVSPEDRVQRLERLELAAGLMPALRHVLDVREVFDHLSTISQRALPHDSLTLALADDDLKTLTLYAQTSGEPFVQRHFPQPYPPAFIHAWDFEILDDRPEHTIERERPGQRPDTRSSLRLPIRIGDRLIAGIGFNSREPNHFNGSDVVIARRLADYVGMSLSHQRLVEESRRSIALQERAANLEMLDELLNTLAGVLDVREVFDRVSAISARVLPHDAMSIAEVLGNGERVRIHASHGLGDLPEPFDIDLPDPALNRDPWDVHLIEDVRERPEYAQGPGWAAGMRSMMFIAIRFEGKHFGGLNFYSKTPGRYTKDDVLIGRRITDHVALALSHRRLAEEARQIEELRARTTSIELLDELLAALTDSGDLPDIFGKISNIAQKVLAHDAASLMVRQPDGIHATLYARSGFSTPPAQIHEVPPELLQNPDWDHDIFDDLSIFTEPRYTRLVDIGLQSLIRVPIRLDGEFAGALVFLSKKLAAFKLTDVVVMRRMAHRLALTLARERQVATSKRADEETARASKLEARVQALTEELDARTGFRRVVGESLEWRQVLKQATQVAPTEATVLLLGESGTGKEVVARFVHRASSRNGGPFVAINCAALPEQLLEAELFGYERGAYTGATQSKPGQLEMAAGGTLFLDEVAEMNPSAQAKFLRVLQEKEFQRLGGTRMIRADARIVAATNRDLPRAMAQGHFRDDLYYRLNVFAIKLPALRDRRDDILTLSEAFIIEIGKNIGRPPAGLAKDARQRLLDYRWPGNVRELRNILERAAILCDGGLITAEHLSLEIAPQPAPAVPHDPAPAAPASAPPSAAPPVAQPSSAGDLEQMERTMIEQALKAARYNKSKAAKALGLTRHQLYIRMKRYGFE